jgi:hypothetical protein
MPNWAAAWITLRFFPLHGRRAHCPSGLRNHEGCSRNGLGQNRWSIIANDPALLQQGKTDIALCQADLDARSTNETARACMSERGYTLVQKDQAEDVRAAYATAAQRASPPSR